MELIDIYAEKDIVAYLLENPSSLPDIKKSLRPQALSNETLKHAYLSCIELYEQKDTFTRAEVFRDLKSKNLEADGKEILKIRVDGILNTDEVVNRLNDLLHKRRLLDTSHQVTDMIAENVDAGSIYMKLAILMEGMEAESIYDVDILSSDEIFERVIKNYEECVGNEKISGVTSGSRLLDYATGGWKEGLVVIGARPSMGKTIVGLDVAKVSAKAGTPTLYISLEMNSIDLYQRLISSEVPQFTYSDLMNYRMNREDIERIKQSKARMLKELPLFIYDSDNRDVNFIANIITAQVRRNKVGLVVIDYLQLMRDSQIKDQSDFAQVSSISNKIQKLTRKLNIPIIALSQLSRNVEGRGDKRPMLADIRSSGNIEQDASIVIGLHRPAYYHDDDSYETLSEDDKHLLEYIILKNRNGQTGITRRYVDVKTNRVSDSFDLYKFEDKPFEIQYKNSKINEIDNGFESEEYEPF